MNACQTSSRTRQFVASFSTTRERASSAASWLVLVATSLVLLPFATAASAADASRWNVLFCFADDWGRYASCYAKIDSRPSINDVIQTPNVDRLAREGVLFRNAFVNAPSCTPCRSSLVSGRYFFNCGRASILQGAVWDGSIPAFPLLLKDAGYGIGKSYKVWSPGTPADAPIGGQQFAYEQSGRMPNNFSEEATKLMEEGASLEEAKGKILGQVGDNFDTFLKAHREGQPWLYWFGTTTTHRVWVKGSGKKLWNIEPDSLAGKLPKFLPDVPEVREDVADYLGECQAVDAELGVLLDHLEKAGQLDKTLIVVSGDHGMPGVPAGKCNLYDHGTAVPLVIRVPGGKSGRVVDDFVCLPDLAPTFMEVGGAKVPEGLYGKSLLPILKSDKAGQVDPERTWVITGRERHVAQAREDRLPYPMRALRTKDFVYVRNFAPDRWPMGSPGAAPPPLPLGEGRGEGASPPSPLAGEGPGVRGQDLPGELPPLKTLESNTFIAFADMDASPTKAWLIQHQTDPKWKWHYDFAFGKRPAEELYDLSKDPDQTHNVATDPAYAEQKQALADQLLSRLQAAQDPRVTGDTKTFDEPPFTDAVAPAAGKKGKGKQKS
jgi:N-sulfoglucosamine sulfohydrolase